VPSFFSASRCDIFCVAFDLGLSGRPLDTLLVSERFQTAVENQTVDIAGAPLSPAALAVVILLFGGLFMVAVIMPLATIAISAFMDTLSGGVVAESLSFRNILGLFTGGSEAWHAILTSLTLAVLAALFTVLIALLVAFTIIRLRSAATVFLDFLSILPNSVPGMAVAVGLILTWNQTIWPHQSPNEKGFSQSPRYSYCF
jgi:iron(III) transport system permease protein